MYSGFLDVSDIVSFILSLVEDGHIKPSSISSVLKSQTAIKIANLSKRHPCPLVTLDASFYDVLILMKAGASRVCVANKEGFIVKVISQSSVIKQLALHFEELDQEMLKCTLDEIKLGMKKVITCNSCDSVLQAVELLSKNKLAAVGIVEDGELISNISASDICLAAAKGEFKIAFINPHNLDEHNKGWISG